MSLYKNFFWSFFCNISLSSGISFHFLSDFCLVPVLKVFSMKITFLFINKNFSFLLFVSSKCIQFDRKDFSSLIILQYLDISKDIIIYMSNFCIGC